MAVSEKQNEDNQETQAKGSIEAVIKKLVKTGKDKGFLTYDQINKAIPAGEFSSEQIDDAMATFNDIGIQLVEKEDDVAEESSDDKAEYSSGGNIADDDTGRTDDPVRMYLREMGAVELLSREGEIAIAKRIEAGRELMIGGICESPLAIESLIAWYKALQEGDILLREIIDLDATYNEGAEEAAAAEAEEAEDGEDADGDENIDGVDDSEDEKEEETPGVTDTESEDEVNVSLAAMEEELQPQVFEIFGKIQKTYNKMQKVQQERMKALQQGEEP